MLKAKKFPNSDPSSHSPFSRSERLETNREIKMADETGQSEQRVLRVNQVLTLVNIASEYCC